MSKRQLQGHSKHQQVMGRTLCSYNCERVLRPHEELYCCMHPQYDFREIFRVFITRRRLSPSNFLWRGHLPVK